MDNLYDSTQTHKALLNKIAELENTIDTLKKELSWSASAMKALENCPDPVLWHGEGERLVYVNKAACDEFGYSKEEFLNLTVMDIDAGMSGKKPDTYDEEMDTVLKENNKRFRSVNIRKDGTTVPVELVGIRRGVDDIDYGITFIRNISDRLKFEIKMYEMNKNLEQKNTDLERLNQVLKKREKDLRQQDEELKQQNEEMHELYEEQNSLYEQLAASEEELKAQNDQLFDQQDMLTEKNNILESIIEASSDGIWYINTKTGFRILSYPWLAASGFKIIMNEGAGDIAWEEVTHPDDISYMRQCFLDLLDGKIPSYECVTRVMHNDGEYRWIRTRAMSICDETGKAYILTGVHSDISSLKKNEEQLKYQAYYDPLTGLPNRTLLMERLASSMKISKRKNTRTAILFVDIDNFKKVNDTLGHSYGDELLREAGNRIAAQVREYDTVARFGGDEFILLFNDVSSNDQLLYLARRVRHCILEPFMVNSTSFHLSCSIGVTIFPDDGSTSDELLKNADVAMYRAKAAGKDKVRFFDKKMKDDYLDKMSLENDLRIAARNMDFAIHFQPQIDVKDNSIRGVELLLRWNNPRLGAVSPAIFIPLAEETGLITPIGNWVVEQACQTAARWKKKYSFNGIFSVNISAVQLRNWNFVNMVHKCVHDAGINPSCLELEITESLFIDSMESAVSKLSALREIGVRISLDDFGTGYSSLSYLKNLPINTLKVDKSFIDEIQAKKPHRNMTASIISLVRDMEIETVAEGVETEVQYEYLKEAGCDFIQGYYTGRPVPEEVLCKLLEESSSH